MPSKSQLFLRYMHNFRGIAIFLILLGHIIPFADLDNTLANNAILTITSNGSVYFIFIAGFLFQFLSAKYKYKDYLKKKFFTVILPYLIISIPAIAYCLIRNRPFFSTSWFTENFSAWSASQKVIILYLTGAHFFHFWFMPVMMLFYILAPALIWIDQNPNCYRVLLPIFTLISMVISRSNDDALVPQNFIHFISVYLLGMFCCRYRDKMFRLMQKTWKPWLIVLFLLTAANIFISLSTELTSPFSWLYLNTASKSLMSMLIIYGLWEFDTRLNPSIHQILGTLADLSFGIYFIHAYIIFIFAVLGKQIRFSYSENLLFLIFFPLVITIVSAILLLTVKRFFGKRSRYLIGC